MTPFEESLPREDPESTAEFVPLSIYTNDAKVITAGDETTETEDWEKATADEFSLCTLLDGATLDDYCRGCKPDNLVVAASSEDWCLKQLGDVFYREICLNPEAVGETSEAGLYGLGGELRAQPYDSIIRPAPDVPGRPDGHDQNVQREAGDTPQSTRSTRRA